ncbi:hypothetical protein BP5796_04726 [Coleophoma crateriformis]|uniref:DUF1740-domain-containing protein n=1 Tax=Coleophoma crateriformis TaxID=565419 RepID=A0A3D8SA71_9HELO|nr:hypothetical protein BP5796_04726 [Coleophoma crateriformis]
MPEQNQPSVPKFASFRPRPAVDDRGVIAREHLPRDLESQKRKNDRPRSQSRERHHVRQGSRSKEKRNRSPRRQDRHRDLNVTSIKCVDDERISESAATNLFITDLEGDMKNLTYGSIHRYAIPLFHRAGAGNVLGADVSVKIDRDHGEETGIVLASRKNTSNHREKYVFAGIQKERPRLLRIRPELVEENLGDFNEDYVSLEPFRARKRRRGSSGSTEAEDETHYRSIHGKAKRSFQPVDKTLQFVSDSDSDSRDGRRSLKIDAELRNQTVKLSKMVDQNPGSNEAWMALIAHQDTLLGAGDDSYRATNAEIKSTAEIKIHMYEKALAHAVSLEDRERLLNGLMDEGSKIWDLKTRSDRWEAIASDNIDSLLLWTNFLNFKQTSFSIFRYEEIRNTYTQRIKALQKAIATKKTETDQATYQQLLYIILRFTLFSRQSGYMELALGIWQGLLEFNFDAPPNLKDDNLHSSFQDFWESEVPRFGEDGAVGWCQYALDPDKSTAPDAIKDEIDNGQRHEGDFFQSWAAAEKNQALASRLPARTMDDVAEDDPFRVILYADIHEFLFQIPKESLHLRDLLINSFLLFCGLPTMPNAQQDLSKIWSSDQFIFGGLLDTDIQALRSQYGVSNEASSSDGAPDISSILACPIKNFAASTSEMFGEFWFRGLGVWRHSYKMDDGPLKYDWVRYSLQQLSSKAFTEDLAEYYLAFEWVNEPSTIKKACKAQLRLHPSCLRLYNAYATIEWARGNKEGASTVFSATLDMKIEKSSIGAGDEILLWKSWIWLNLDSLSMESATRHILSISDRRPGVDIEITTSSILKSSQYLESNRDHLLSSGDYKHAVIHTEVLALLHYMTSESTGEPQSSSQGNITAALAVFSHGSDALVSRRLKQSTVHEQLLQAATRLLFHHIQNGPFRPALLRSNLLHFLELFPQNTMFISLYAWNESRLRIDARVRTLLNSNILSHNNDTLTSRLFAIKHEIANGTTHSTRAAFEHAISSPVCQNCAGLWKLYVLWSVWIAESGIENQRQKELERAKAVWYRGIRACPWSKKLYMLSMTVLRGVGIMDDKVLSEIGRVLSEKELRIHIDIDDRLENWAQGNQA